MYRLHEDFSKILKRCNLKENDAVLDNEVSTLHATEIAAHHCHEWGRLLVYLFSENEKPDSIKKDIEKKVGEPQQQREEFFNVWIKKKGNDATYKALISALLHISCRADAEFVCKILSGKGEQTYMVFGDLNCIVLNRAPLPHHIRDIADYSH